MIRIKIETQKRNSEKKFRKEIQKRNKKSNKKILL
jgi:hypothetical protein